ncbi:hypothetical protein Leryth_010410, partial [Lithospermum erythrorhizon]
AFFDLENTNPELKSELKDLYINSAVQIDVSGNRKAVVIHVPYRLRKGFRKIHLRLVREFEKKFSGKHRCRCILIGYAGGLCYHQRKALLLETDPKTHLHLKICLKEIVVGKRVRYSVDGSKIMKVFLDPKARNDTEYKLETFSAVYRKLSGKDVVFEFPVADA